MNAINFLSGITVATFLASALFFLKFWKASRDRFFAYFAAACVLIAGNHFVALFIQATQNPLWTSATETTSWVYLTRLAAFIMIMMGIWDKNWMSRK